MSDSDEGNPATWARERARARHLPVPIPRDSTIEEWVLGVLLADAERRQCSVSDVAIRNLRFSLSFYLLAGLATLKEPQEMRFFCRAYASQLKKGLPPLVDRAMEDYCEAMETITTSEVVPPDAVPN